MCAVSMIGDMFTKTAPDWVLPHVWPQPSLTLTPLPQVSRAEFDALKAQVTEIAKLLKAAKAYDTATGQPDCENEEKLALLRKLAEMVGVDLGL